jgi:hypothetical protein
MAAPRDTSAERLTGGRGLATQALRGALWIVVVGVVVQVFLAGLFNFGDTGARETHEGVGWSVHTIGLVALVLALLGPRTKELTLALVVLNTVQIVLSSADTAAVAALHPTLGLAVLALAAWLAVRVGAPATAPRTP